MRTRRTATAIGLAVAAALGFAAGTAEAAFTNVEWVGKSSVETSSDKSVTVTCPAGKKVTGAGADVTPGGGDVLITEIRPDVTLTSVTVRAVEDEDGTGASWWVAAYAVCATPPVGLERVAAASPASSAGKEVTAACPAGKRVLGVGGEVGPAAGQILLDGLRPKLDLTGAVVNALEDETGTTISWAVTAYAICATAPVTGLQRVATTTAAGSPPSQIGSTPCPAGKVLVGMGAEVNSAGGQVVLDAVFPKNDLDAAGAGAWEDDTGNLNPWSLTTYAMCAAHAVRVAVTSPPSDFGKGADAPCPAGTAIAGMGAGINGAFGRAWMTQLRPDGDGVVRFQADAGGAYDFTATSAAVCLTATAIPSREVVLGSADGGMPVTATLGCPSGKRLLGIGGEAEAFAGDDRIAVDAMVPNPALTGASVTASNFLGASAVGDVAAYGICAAAPSGLQLVTKTSLANSEEYKSATATCPAGKHVIGAGGAVPSGRHAILDDALPNAALTAVTASGAEDSTHPEGDWAVTAYAICIRR